MKNHPDLEVTGRGIASGLTSVKQIRGDDELDTGLLNEMAQDATRYISQFTWCEEVLETYFGGGVGGIFAIFFFHIRPSCPEVDSWIWIMIGDIPPAYLPLGDCNSPEEAFEIYMDGMSKWVEFARNGQTGTAHQGVPPVNMPATPEWAERLQQKLDGLTAAVKPLFDTSSQRLGG
jgi:hypothetical protein